MLVYVITFDNGKSYVGVTSDLKRRIREHRSNTSAVGSAMRVHGRSVRGVFGGGPAECFAEERRLIAALGTLAPGGYNLTTGGEGGFDMPPELVAQRGHNISKAFTPQKRAEHSEKLKVAHRAPGMQEAQSKRALGSWARPEFRAAVSEAARKQAKASWSDPTFRERHHAAMERYRSQMKLGEAK